MEILSAKNITFAYPDAQTSAVTNINFSVNKGEFIVLCGPSGSGKSTLLQLIKHDIAPHGRRHGHILYKGKELENHPAVKRAKDIGMVFQHPDHQIVMENVMDELLFGLENIGCSTAEMRKKVAEMVHFFDLNHLLAKKTHELSGGEKQLLNLASVLLLDPEVLLLDEPTGQLDPIASREFFHTLERVNDEFGITILVVEHQLEELFSIADKVMVLEGGYITHFDAPKEVIRQLSSQSNLQQYLPITSKVYLNYSDEVQPECIPVNVKGTKQWLDRQQIMETNLSEQQAATVNEDHHKDFLQLKEIDFQYDRYTPLVLNNLSMSVARGEWHAILGANGSGKSTLLKVISGIVKPQHGYVTFNGKKQKRIDAGQIGYLPQDPALFFVQDSLMKEYRSIADAFGMENAETVIETWLDKFQFASFKDRHPYDLSGGERQKAALIGALLVNPSILLIDEPTKGLDPQAKEKLGTTLQSLMEEGMTIMMVTHDVEFAASYATRCSMIFQGDITVTENTRQFFQENMYYTTVMNRITRKMDVPTVVTLQEAKRKWRLQKNI
ncbi:energy-coupling factor transporter ATPase [Lentibacillus sp. N15]|uniref:ABC transporter ATP-binding protein n=1 Tax=Lentibacillus songyuanensis TaxID=3136161 RepID=UPI0031BA50F7